MNKEDLAKLLNEHNYYDFILEITKLEITEENYDVYLNTLSQILFNQLSQEELVKKTPGEKLLEVFNQEKKEETFFDMVPKLRTAIKEVFEKKLGISENYSDDEKQKLIVSKLEEFEEKII